MALMTWKEMYSVGIKEMDDQHKIIFEIINDLFVSLKKQDSAGSAASILIKLRRYSLSHFSAEESMLQQKKSPLLKWQQQEHSIFIEKLDEFGKKIEQKNNKSLEIEMSNFLLNWWNTHILNGDKKYKPI